MTRLTATMAGLLFLLLGCSSPSKGPSHDVNKAITTANTNFRIVTRFLAPDEEQEEFYKIQIEFWKQQSIQKTHTLSTKQSWCELASIEAKALEHTKNLYVVTFVCEKGEDNFFRNVTTLLISVDDAAPQILHQDEGLFESSPFCKSYDLPAYTSLDAHTVAITRESQKELVDENNCKLCSIECGSDQNCLLQCKEHDQFCIESQECLLRPITLYQSETISY